MEGQYLIYGSIIVLALVIVIVILYFIKKVELKYYKEKIKNLSIENITIEKGLKEELKKFLPQNTISTLRKVRTVMGQAVGGYVRAQMIIMVVVFCV